VDLVGKLLQLGLDGLDLFPDLDRLLVGGELLFDLLVEGLAGIVGGLAQGRPPPLTATGEKGVRNLLCEAPLRAVPAKGS
jgi:hypothetical protein